MKEFRYMPGALNSDLARAGIGFALSAIPLALISLEPWLMLLLATFAGLFVIFGVRTWLRRGVCVAVDDAGITATGQTSAHLSWDELTRFKLSYFSTRRDRSNGWMQLNLRAPSGRLSIDSNLDGFDEVCRRAFRAAADNDVVLSDASLRNLAELGLVTDLAPKTQAGSGTGWGNPADWRR